MLGAISFGNFSAQLENGSTVTSRILRADTYSTRPGLRFAVHPKEPALLPLSHSSQGGLVIRKEGILLTKLFPL